MNLLKISDPSKVATLQQSYLAERCHSSYLYPSFALWHTAHRGSGSHQHNVPCPALDHVRQGGLHCMHRPHVVEVHRPAKHAHILVQEQPCRARTSVLAVHKPIQGVASCMTAEASALVINTGSTLGL